jgi:hypothetical protein
VDLRLVLPRLLRLLLLLVAVLPVIHHLRDGRIRLRCDLDEVETLAVRVLQRLRDGLDPDLAPVVVDEPHPRRANLVVDPVLRGRANRRLHAPPRSQRLVTKLALFSFS